MTRTLRIIADKTRIRSAQIRAIRVIRVLFCSHRSNRISGYEIECGGPAAQRSLSAILLKKAEIAGENLKEPVKFLDFILWLVIIAVGRISQ
jgi:hypothetical protein